MGLTSEHHKRFRKYACQTLLGFSLAYAFLYTGRLNMGLALPIMTKELGWSLSMAGVINSVLFWAYSLGNLVNGRLGELIGVKRFIMAGILLSVLTNWAVSFLTVPLVIAVLWGFNGYFQSMVWAPGMSMLSKWWTKSERGFAGGIANGFSGIAQIIAWFTVAAAVRMMPSWGWRAAFRLPVVSLFMMAFVYWYMVKEKPSDVGLPDYEEDDPDAKKLEKEYLQEKGRLYPYVALFSQWHFDVYCIIVALSSIIRYGLLTWIPMYYVTVMHMNVKGGIISSVLLPIGMAAGTFIAPWATDKLFQTNRSPAVAICAAAAALTVFIFPRMTTILSAAFILFWAGFFVYGINGVASAYSMDVGSRVFAGTAAGILQWAAYMGVALQAMVFGYILDKMANWTVFFVTMAVTCIIIVVLATIISIRPVSRDLNAGC